MEWSLEFGIFLSLFRERATETRRRETRRRETPRRLPPLPPPLFVWTRCLSPVEFRSLPGKKKTFAFFFNILFKFKTQKLRHLHSFNHWVLGFGWGDYDSKNSSLLNLRDPPYRDVSMGEFRL